MVEVSRRTDGPSRR